MFGLVALLVVSCIIGCCVSVSVSGCVSIRVCVCASVSVLGKCSWQG